MTGAINREAIAKILQAIADSLKPPQQLERPRWWWFGETDPIARYTKWLSAYTFLLATATILSAIILWRTDTTLRETLEVTERPWLSIGAVPTGDIESDDIGFSVQIEYLIKNTGRSPAIEARVFDKIYVGGLTGLLDAEKEICSHGSFPNSELGYNVFPDAVVRHRTALIAEPSELDSAVRANEERQKVFKTSPFDKTIVNVWIIGCLNYKFTFGDLEKLHKTAFALQVIRLNPANQGGRQAIRTTDNLIPLSDLQIDSNSFFGSKAN